MTFTLTAQQAQGIERLRDWYTSAAPALEPSGRWSADVFRWFGYAGTGKTFTAARIPEALGLTNVVYGTYTGKAAHVLRASLARYGVSYPVSTIHSAIYLPTADREARERLRAAQEDIAALESGIEAEDGPALDLVAQRDAIEAQLPALAADTRRLAFELNPMSEWATADLIILDEVSMVNAKLAADIESFGVPILVLGDPAQLPPVEGGGYYTNARPDHLLTDIQRQALDNPITALATRVRESTGRRLGLVAEDLEPPSIRRAAEFDQVLVWSNRRRWAMVAGIRKVLGLGEIGQVVQGDRIMCLTNNRELGVFNGQQFEVVAVGADLRLGLRDDEGRERVIDVLPDGFMGQEMQTQAKNGHAGGRGPRMLATYAQAITCHKAQGSEWGRVYVVNELPSMLATVTRREGETAAINQARAWTYTACTRAKDEVVITAARSGR